MNATMFRCRGLRHVAMVLSMAIAAAACSNGGNKPTTLAQGDKASGKISAQVASYDLVAGRAGRFIVGLLAADQSQLVGFGTAELRFAYLGQRGAVSSTVPAGPPMTAQFLPVPGQNIDLATPGPRFVRGSQGIGVYGVSGVTFDRAGFWQVIATAMLDGKRRSAEAAFEVTDRSLLPGPGDLAPRTENPIAGAAGVDPRSIDSRADAQTPIPDPELHRTTVAGALAAGRPLMVVVSTPTYCQSRFCGPITDSVSALAKRYGDRMDFVHLEVWKNFENKEVNKAAAEWIYPPGSSDAQEPWVFVVGRDGRIAQRFDNVATDAELEKAVTEVSR